MLCFNRNEKSEMIEHRKRNYLLKDDSRIKKSLGLGNFTKIHATDTKNPCEV